MERRTRRAAEAPAAGAKGSAALPGPDVANPVEEALSALVALGYKPQEASRMVRAIDSSELSTEDIIRAALQATVKP